MAKTVTAADEDACEQDKLFLYEHGLLKLSTMEAIWLQAEIDVETRDVIKIGVRSLW